ncbi:hypothetical protein [Flavobacterium suaedae]|nr:hypothetical protein [Flavobacterium suaedae]
MKKMLLLNGLLFLFVSCDCHQIIRGTVIDKETNKPLENILVYKKSDKEYTRILTDSLGIFELSDVSGGLWGCPPMEIVIEGEGYLKKEGEIPAGGEKTIELEVDKNSKQ